MLTGMQVASEIWGSSVFVAAALSGAVDDINEQERSKKKAQTKSDPDVEAHFVSRQSCIHVWLPCECFMCLENLSLCVQRMWFWRQVAGDEDAGMPTLLRTSLWQWSP